MNIHLEKHSWGDFEVDEELERRVNDLAANARGGHHQAMHELYYAFAFKITRFVRRYRPDPLPDGYVLEDLDQEAYIVFAGLVSDWQGADFCTFFFGVFPWRLRRHFRKLAKTWRRERIVYLSPEEMDLITANLATAGDATLVALLEAILLDLPETEREVALLHLRDDLPFTEIARRLSISRSLAYRTWARALSHLVELEAV